MTMFKERPTCFYCESEDVKFKEYYEKTIFSGHLEKKEAYCGDCGKDFEIVVAYTYLAIKG